MKQLFPGFPAPREPSRAVGPRLQPSLHGLANPQILILHAISDRDTPLVVRARRLADIAEIEIENHAAMIHINWNHQICIQISLVAIEHEVWMQPEIPGSVAS